MKRGRSSQQTADSPFSCQQSKKSNVLERNVRVSLFNESSEVQPVERMSSQFRPIASATTDNTRNDRLHVMLLKAWLTRHRNRLAMNSNAEYDEPE